MNTKIIRDWARLLVITAISLFATVGCAPNESTTQVPNKSQETLSQAMEASSDSRSLESETSEDGTTESHAGSEQQTTDAEVEVEFPPELLEMLRRLAPHGHYFTDYVTETTDFAKEFTIQEVSVKIGSDYCVPVELVGKDWVLVKHHPVNAKNADKQDASPRNDYSLFNLKTHESHYLLSGDEKTSYVGSDEEGHYLLFEKEDKDSLLFAVDTKPYTSGNATGSDTYRANKIVITHSLAFHNAGATNFISNDKVLYLEAIRLPENTSYALMEYDLSQHTKRIIEDAIREDFMYLDRQIFFSEFLSEKEMVLRNQDGSVRYPSPTGFSLSPIAVGTRVFYLVEKEYEGNQIGTHAQLYEVFSDGTAPQLVAETSVLLRDFRTKNGFLKWSHNTNTIPLIFDTVKNKIIRFDALTTSATSQSQIAGWNFVLGQSALILNVMYRDNDEQIQLKHYLLTRK